MIPKIIHHVWLGDSEPDAFLLRCRQTALDLHPDWQHVLHRDESAFDDPVFDESFRQQLREAAKRARSYRTKHNPLALVSDLLRLTLLYIHGGIYLDLDMEVVKPLDGFLDEDLILSAFGPTRSAIGEFILGAPSRSPAIKIILTRLLVMRPISSNDGLIVPSVYPGLVAEHDWRVWPREYFCPLDWCGSGVVTEDTYTVHHWFRKNLGRGKRGGRIG